MNPHAPAIERFLPEYRVRHIFSMKIRLAAFVGFWAFLLVVCRGALAEARPVAAVVFVCFLLTGVAYAFIMRGRFLLPSFALELGCDLVAITAVVWFTGGPYGPGFTLYLLYVVLAGVLYAHRLAAAVAVAAAAAYALFLLLDGAGLLLPPAPGGHPPMSAITPLARFAFAAVALAGIVYTVRVAGVFSQRRERILERRNRELTALQRMGSTVRSAGDLRDVIDRLLAGILEGLNFETALLLLFDRASGQAIVHVPRGTPRGEAIGALLGRPVDGMALPLAAIAPLVLQDIRRGRVIFRRRLSELALGLSAIVTPGQCDAIQESIGARRIVVMPVVVEGEALGALVGFSREPFVEEEQVATLESFANQSALSLEAAAMIDRLRRLNEKLEEASRVKSEFLAAMSHELRTPLTAIIGFSELLMEGVMGELAEPQKESLREVLHNAADLLELINSLLDLTKIESGRMQLEVRPFDLLETVRRVLATIAPLVRKKRQMLDARLPEALPPIAGDERKVQQLILNLLANANKFTPEGGRIEASVRRFGSREEIEAHAPWRERVRSAADAFARGAVEIVVADDGIGVAPDHLERIFEMFHQVDGSATRSFGGTGVGLALARQFVEMHGGRIWVESEWGRGARFVVVLPTVPAAG